MTVALSRFLLPADCERVGGMGDAWVARTRGCRAALFAEARMGRMEVKRVSAEMLALVIAASRLVW